MYSCTVHRTVISTEHLAITNAGFFVLLVVLPWEILGDLTDCPWVSEDGLGRKQ